jgi:hypothetical protein
MLVDRLADTRFFRESTCLNGRSPSSVGPRLRSHKTETCPEIVGSLDRSPKFRILGKGIKAGARPSDDTGALC